MPRKNTELLELLLLALGGEGQMRFLLPAPECSSVQLQLLLWYSWPDTEGSA